MAVRIITDSTSDFSQAEGKQYNFDVVPLKVIFPERDYLDGVEISLDEFYNKLMNQKELPTTSQPTPLDFISVFEKVKEANDEAVVILLASELSGTYQSALLAKDYVNYDKIYICDSETAATSLRLLVQVALDRRDEGCSAEAIYNEIEILKNKVTIKAIVDTLDYLVKGGRLSKAAAIAGSLLSIKPLIEVTEGKVKVIAKARGRKGAMEALYKEVMKDGEIDFNHHVYVAYTHDTELANSLKDFLKEKEIATDGFYEIGSVIGTHAGPGACAIAYFKK